MKFKLLTDKDEVKGSKIELDPVEFLIFRLALSYISEDENLNYLDRTIAKRMLRESEFYDKHPCTDCEEKEYTICTCDL